MMLRLKRLVTTDECPWLDRDFKQGEIVHQYTGYTYGCISPHGVGCSERDGETPFFELPSDALERRS